MDRMIIVTILFFCFSFLPPLDNRLFPCYSMVGANHRVRPYRLLGCRGGSPRPPS